MHLAPPPYSHLAFAGDERIARGSLAEVALAVRRAMDAGEERPIIVLDAATSQTVDLDLRGQDADIVGRLPPAVIGTTDSSTDAGTTRSAGPGRPRLGVVSREVSLLPRHWQWLKSQRGGASAALRRLVEEARRTSGARDRQVAAQEAVDRYLRVMGGDRPNYEEALRAFYAGRVADLYRWVADWPVDVRDHLQHLLACDREDPST